MIHGVAALTRWRDFREALDFYPDAGSVSVTGKDAVLEYDQKYFNLTAAAGALSVTGRDTGDWDRFWDYTKLLVSGDGSNNGTTFTDESSLGATITRTNTVTSTAQKKFGTASAYFDGSGDILSATNAAYQIGTGDFTAEAWVYFVNGGKGQAFSRIFQIGKLAEAGAIYLNTVSTQNPTRIFVEGYTTAYTNITSQTTPATIANNTWHHIALTRSGTTVTIWLNGASYVTATSSYNATKTDLYIGNSDTGGNSFNGYIDEFRLTVGKARYSGAFTPPAAAFPRG